MATVNIGNIKFNWKGPWSNSTTYAVDDVVSLSGSSYISIQAGSNQNPASASAYWEQMSSAGTNGDTFGLANKEIAFKTNAGALDGIPIGTAGQALKVNSGATGYEFGAVAGGKVGQVIQATMKTAHDMTINAQWVTFPNDAANGDFTATITPSATSSKILILLAIRAMIPSGQVVRSRLTRDGSATGYQGNASGSRPLGYAQYYFGNDSPTSAPLDGVYLDSPSSTSALSYKVQLGADGTSSTIGTNRTRRDDSNAYNDSRLMSTITLMEILA